MNTFINTLPVCEDDVAYADSWYRATVNVYAQVGGSAATRMKSVAYHTSYEPAYAASVGRETAAAFLAAVEQGHRHQVGLPYVPLAEPWRAVQERVGRSSAYLPAWTKFDMSRVVQRLAAGMTKYVRTGTLTFNELSGGRAVNVHALAVVDRATAPGSGTVYVPDSVETVSTPGVRAALIAALTGCGSTVVVDSVTIGANNAAVVQTLDGERLMLAVGYALELLSRQYAASGMLSAWLAALISGLSIGCSLPEFNGNFWCAYTASMSFAPPSGVVLPLPYSDQGIAWPDGTRPGIARFVDSMLLTWGACITVSDPGQLVDGKRVPVVLPQALGETYAAARLRQVVQVVLPETFVTMEKVVHGSAQPVGAVLSAIGDFCRTTQMRHAQAGRSYAACMVVEPTGILKAGVGAGVVKAFVDTDAEPAARPLIAGRTQVRGATSIAASVNLGFELWRECAIAWWIGPTEHNHMNVGGLNPARVAGFAFDGSVPTLIATADTVAGIDPYKHFCGYGGVNVRTRLSAQDGWDLVATSVPRPSEWAGTASCWVSRLDWIGRQPKLHTARGDISEVLLRAGQQPSRESSRVDYIDFTAFEPVADVFEGVNARSSSNADMFEGNEDEVFEVGGDFAREGVTAVAGFGAHLVAEGTAAGAVVQPVVTEHQARGPAVPRAVHAAAPAAQQEAGRVEQ